MRVPKGLIAAIRKEPVFLLATHINPDGDALGSCLALAEALKSLGKTVFVYDRDPVPEQYQFMPGARRFRTTIGGIPSTKPFLVLLDCNSPERAAVEESSFNKSAVIDHHETETDFGDIRWIVPEAAATGLMVFHLIKALRIAVTKAMATNLYIALAVDTGTFRYSNTGPDVLRAGAELIEAGAAPGTIAEHLYEQWKKNRFDLLTLSLRTLEIEDRIALMYVTQDMFSKTATGEADTENFANLPRMIDSVLISALIRQVDNGRWKVSMRSKGQVNVAKIAEVFGGGGHRNAAGFRIKADLEDVKKAILKSGRGILSKL
jgi:bifunctional oligoribonuclease and PAP phosphatase NrnA